MLVCLAFFAGLVRGYSGFGFAMLLSLGLLLRYSPAEAVPVALMLDVAASFSLWPSAIKAFHRPIGMRLIGGMLLAIPLGTAMLSHVPALWMTPLVGLFCLIGGVLVLWRPVVSAGPASSHMALPAGVLSGLAMSLASSGGPPLILYLLRSGLDPIRLRAVAVVFFAVTSTVSLLGFWLFDALHHSHASLALTLLLPALLGNLAGQWLCRRWPPVSLRWAVGGLLVVMSSIVLCSGLWKLYWYGG